MQRIKRALKKIGSKNGVRLALLCGYCLAFGIPFLHVYMATPPTQDEMRIVEGRAHFQYRVKRGYMLMVDGKDYTCAGQYLNADPDCFNVSESPAKRTLLEGKTVEILWFHQSAPIFGLARRVADIRYDGVSQLPPHFLEKGLQYEKDSAGTDALITFSGMLLMLLFYEWMDRIRIRNERRFGWREGVASMPWSVADSLSTGPARNGKQPARTFSRRFWRPTITSTKL